MVNAGNRYWFVEEAVGNVDPELLQLMDARSPIARSTTGEVIRTRLDGKLGSNASTLGGAARRERRRDATS